MTAKRAAADYQAVVSRGERFWIIHVPALDRYTQVRRLSEREEMTTDLIESVSGKRPKSIEFIFDLPELQAHLDRAKALREEAAAANSEAAAEVRAAARALHDEGVPLRDIGEVLGVGYQRAHQLVSEAS